MKKIFFVLFFGALIMQAEPLAKFSLIEVDCKYLDEYKEILRVNAEKSVKLEKGVLILYPAQHEDNPCRFSILEVYENNESYEKHIKTEHFLHYKNSTLHMVKSLEFVPLKALNEAMFLNKE